MTPAQRQIIKRRNERRQAKYGHFNHELRSKQAVEKVIAMNEALRNKTWLKEYGYMLVLAIGFVVFQLAVLIISK